MSNDQMNIILVLKRVALISSALVVGACCAIFYKTYSVDRTSGMAEISANTSPISTPILADIVDAGTVPNPNTGKRVVELDEEQNTSATGTYQNNQKHGVWTFYHDNGEISSVGNFVEGVKSGHWNFFSETGQLLSEGEFENGEEHGQWSFYRDNGSLSSRGTFTNGIKTGEWEFYNDDGSIEYKGALTANGKRTGEWTFYTASENTTSATYTYEDGILNGMARIYFPNGDLKLEGIYKNDKRVGEWIWFMKPNTNEYWSGMYNEQGERDGEWKFYSNGVLISVATYEKNKLLSNQLIRK